jgi:hypothetical protein
MKVHLDVIKERNPELSDLAIWQLTSQVDDEGFISLSIQEAEEYNIVISTHE